MLCSAKQEADKGKKEGCITPYFYSRLSPFFLIRKILLQFSCEAAAGKGHCRLPKGFCHLEQSERSELLHGHEKCQISHDVRNDSLAVVLFV